MQIDTLHWTHSKKTRVEIRTSDNIQFIDVVYLRTSEVCLATDSGIRQRPTYGQIQIISPWNWCKSLLHRRIQHINPQLLSADVRVETGSLRCALG